MQKLELQWKQINIDLRAVDAKLRSEYPSYKGNQAANCLELWFEEMPSQEDQDTIKAYWEALDESSSEAVSYKSEAQLEIEKQNKKLSAKAKLLALGLSEEEVAALSL